MKVRNLIMPFIENMLKALENDAPTEDMIKKANGVGDPEIDPETDAVVKDGNPDSPGDDGSPIGDKDKGGEPKEIGSEAEANADDGNPDSPGEGTPDPEATATEGLFPSRESMNAAKNMSSKQVFEKYLEGLKIKGVQFVSDKSKIIGDGDSDGKYMTLAGVTVYAHMDGQEIDSINFVKSNGTNAGKVMSVTVAAARKSAARWMDSEKKADRKAAKNADKAAAKQAVESMKKIPGFMRAAFESDVDDADVAKLNGVDDTSKVPDTDIPELGENIGIHKRNNLIEIQQEKDNYAKDGNPDSPGADGDPVSKSGDATKAPENEFDKDSTDKSGSVDEPGEDGTPVSPSGDSKETGKNNFEKDSDAKDGNPDSPGDEGDPVDPATEAFIAACEGLMTTRKPGAFDIPMDMSLEAYVMSLGYGVLLDRALEGSMTAAERRALPDKAFALPAQRKYPLTDESHVSNAIAYFRFCPEEDRDECAKNIIKAIRKYDMKVVCTKGNPFIKYYPKCEVVSPKRKAKTA